MKTTTIFMFVLITALGAAAVTTAISFVDQIDAKSCNQTHDKGVCWGCRKSSQGHESSDSKCLHEPDE
jgi:hypothetical protein